METRELSNQSRPLTKTLGTPASTVRLVKPLSLIVFAIACMDLVGWFAHIPLLTSFIPNYATMKPNTGLCFLLLAGACATSQRGSRFSRGPSQFLRLLMNVSAITISIWTLLEYLTRTSSGLDTFLVRVPPDHFGDPPGRMALGTALCFTMSGLSILLAERTPRLTTGLSLIVVATANSALIGFLFSAGPLFGVPWFSSVAVHTALCFLLLSAAFFASRPEIEPVPSFLYRVGQSEKAPWLFLGVTVLPVVLTLPAVLAMRRGIVDVGFTMALMVVLLTSLQSWILWRDSRALMQASMHREQVERALVQSEKLAVVGRMSASISHEIKNPLEAVNNLLYLIDGATSLAEAREFAATASGEVARINQIATQTLSFYRESKNRSNCEPSKVIESALQLLAPKIAEAGVEMTRQYREGTELVGCPDGELRQVFINLISNAIEATPPGGKLIVRTRLSHRWTSREVEEPQRGLRILCADNGTGMPADVRKKIFDPFFTTKAETGNGLGLWVAQGLISNLGGSIRVWSSTLHGASGTVFCIFLPLS